MGDFHRNIVYMMGLRNVRVHMGSGRLVTGFIKCFIHNMQLFRLAPILYSRSVLFFIF